MSKDVEIEFKNILSEAEYQKIFDAFEFDKKEPNMQTNIYFDTPDNALAQIKTAVRLRRTSTYNHLTLKQPLSDQKTLETTESLSDAVSDQIEDTGCMPNTDEIGKTLYNLGVLTKKLGTIGKFETIRYEAEWHGHTIALDHVKFAHFSDYELEMETDDFEQGASDFKAFLQEFEIVERPSLQKVLRMTRLEPLYSLEDDSDNS